MMRPAEVVIEMACWARDSSEENAPRSVVASCKNRVSEPYVMLPFHS